MRRTTKLLFLSLFLALFADLAGAQALPGLELSGTVVLQTKAGTEAGTIKVSSRGADHCKVVLDLTAGGRTRLYSATAVGNRASVAAPAGMAEAVPLPIGPLVGCGFLPTALSPKATATLDPASGRVAGLTWDEHGHQATLAFSDFSATGTFAATVVVRVGEATRLTAHLTSLTPRTFNDSEFVLPPAPTPRVGGAR